MPLRWTQAGCRSLHAKGTFEPTSPGSLSGHMALGGDAHHAGAPTCRKKPAQVVSTLAGSSLYLRSSSSRYELDVPSRKLSYILLMGTGSGLGASDASRELANEADCSAFEACTRCGDSLRATTANMANPLVRNLPNCAPVRYFIAAKSAQAMGLAPGIWCVLDLHFADICTESV
jgi:hypothetical protein